MEHSALHAIQLIGLILTLGGAIFFLLFLRPTIRALGVSAERSSFAGTVSASVARWAYHGGMAAAVAALIDLLVQSAEIQGRTIFAGVSPAFVAKFALQSDAGRLSLCRAALLILAAVAARGNRVRGWGLAAVSALGAVFCASMVSHAAAQPMGRASIVATQILHLIGIAAWLGPLLHLLLVRNLIQAATRPVDVALTTEILRRFSPWAMGAVALLLMSGTVSLCRFVSEPAALLTSAYGLTLLVKLLLLAIAFYAGWINFRVVRPALAQLCQRRTDPAAPETITKNSLTRFGRTLELEVTAGLLVIAVAGIVGSISPPGEPGNQRLTTAQTQALLSPSLPSTTPVDPNSFFGAPERTLADRRHSEFMHHWAGVAVCLLGACWLIQTTNGSGVGARWAARIWPCLLVLFGAFIAVASDVEIWLLRRVTFWQVIADPELFEHQVGGAMVCLMAALAWRDQNRPAWQRPLGFALPIIMVCGSLLLLGHAHSTLTSSEALTSIINVQHAIFGGFGLSAGVVRWLQLRQLMPGRVADWIWPSLVVGLGLFMAFYYQEIV